MSTCHPRLTRYSYPASSWHLRHPIVALSDPAGPQSSAACAVVASDLGFGPRCRTWVRQWPGSGSDLA